MEEDAQVFPSPQTQACRREPVPSLARTGNSSAYGCNSPILRDNGHNFGRPLSFIVACPRNLAQRPEFMNTTGWVGGFGPALKELDSPPSRHSCVP